jgi:hypothetical protein
MLLKEQQVINASYKCSVVGLVMRIVISFLMHGMVYIKTIFLIHCIPKFQFSCWKTSLYPLMNNLIYC